MNRGQILTWTEDSHRKETRLPSYNRATLAWSAFKQLRTKQVFTKGSEIGHGIITDSAVLLSDIIISTNLVNAAGKGQD